MDAETKGRTETHAKPQKAQRDFGGCRTWRSSILLESKAGTLAWWRIPDQVGTLRRDNFCAPGGFA